MVMSRDPGFKFRKFLFLCLILYSILGKLPNLGGIGSGTKSYRQKKTNWGVEKTPRSAYRVK